LTFDGFRVAVFQRSTGRVLSDARIAPPVEPGSLTIGAIDATWLWSGHWVIGKIVHPMTAPPATPMLVSDSMSLQITGADGKSGQSIGVYGEPPLYYVTHDGSGVQDYLPFGRGFRMTVDDSSVWITDTDHYEIRRFGGDGSLRQIVRVQM